MNIVSNTSYKPKVTLEKKDELLQLLQGYRINDVWDLRDNFFEVYDSKESWRSNKKRIDFTSFSFYIRQELKYFFAIEILNRSVTIGTLLSYSFTFKHLAAFLNKHYPNIHSFIEIPYERGLMKYKSYLINRNVNITNSKGQISSKAIAFFNRAYQFLFDFYDIREEFEKDIWDVRNIPNVRYSKSKAEYRISFHDIHPSYREAVKKYAKFTTVSRSFSSLQTILRGIKHFIVFLGVFAHPLEKGE